ncbi:hypothetical protein G210_3593 [Candida maltosa Xu316]|uniref:Uncharacterized protein n=1 Tax=Candida maltosa (strain Xu316) TaxID=1245528 RepID=M3JTK2_CANMX|nr:hypothetical protein G210_3593 [Candida maltosa Xu316]
MSGGFFKDISGNKGDHFFGSTGNHGNESSKTKEVVRVEEDQESSIGSDFEIELHHDTKNELPIDSSATSVTIAETSKSKREPSIKENRMSQPTARAKLASNEDIKKIAPKTLHAAPRILPPSRQHEPKKQKNELIEHPRKLAVEVSDSSLERSFSDVISQLETVNHNLKKDLEVVKKKLKYSENQISKKEKLLRKCNETNLDLHNKMNLFAENLNNIHAKLTVMEEEKNDFLNKNTRTQEEMVVYKKKVSDAKTVNDELKMKLNNIKTQVQLQVKLKDSELHQKESEIDQITGFLSEEKLKVWELQKKLTDWSELLKTVDGLKAQSGDLTEINENLKTQGNDIVEHINKVGCSVVSLQESMNNFNEMNVKNNLKIEGLESKLREVEEAKLNLEAILEDTKNELFTKNQQLDNQREKYELELVKAEEVLQEQYKLSEFSQKELGKLQQELAAADKLHSENTQKFQNEISLIGCKLNEERKINDKISTDKEVLQIDLAETKLKLKDESNKCLVLDETITQLKSQLESNKLLLQNQQDLLDNFQENQIKPLEVKLAIETDKNKQLESQITKVSSNEHSKQPSSKEISKTKHKRGKRESPLSATKKKDLANDIFALTNIHSSPPSKKARK